MNTILKILLKKKDIIILSISTLPIFLLDKKMLKKMYYPEIYYK
jgi:hypothetical protein